MDRLIIEASGYPADLDLIRRMEQSYNVALKSMVGIVGENCIIDGVEDDGTNISAGHIIYNGEILPFKTGSSQSRFKVVSIVHTGFYDGNSNPLPVFEERYAISTNEPNGILLSSLFRLRALKDSITHLGSATLTFENTDGSANSTITTTGILQGVQFRNTGNGAYYDWDWVFNPEIVTGDYFIRIIEENGNTNFVNYDGYFKLLQSDFAEFFYKFKLEIFKYIRA